MMPDDSFPGAATALSRMSVMRRLPPGGGTDSREEKSADGTAMRQPQAYSRAVPFLTLDLDAAAMLFHDVLDH